MSLLEDIFLQDEADEAQELERVIEGDEYDERPRSRSGSPNSDGNEPKDDEAEEDKRRVDPSSTKTKRVTKNPRFLLNPARLTGPRGIQIIPNHFKDFKFKGKGHEKEDLDMVLKKLEHWAYRLYPKFQFGDCLKKIESLGKKRPVMVHLHKIRTDQFMSEETVVQKDSSDEETQPPQEQDEFDKLLQQQIDLARATPAPGSMKKIMGTPKKDRSPFTMPKATSSPSISDNQKERMIRNRKLAEERRLARLKQSSMEASAKQDTVIIEVDEEAETNVTAKKTNRSYVIDSSDDECDVTSENQSVAIDVHNNTKKGEERNGDSKVLKETRGNNPNDIVMDENFDNNNAIEVTEDVVVIDNIDKDMSRNVRGTEHADTVVDEIIEINDPTDERYETNQVDNGVIEINGETNQETQIIAIDDETVKVSRDIEINDDIIEIIDDVTHTESKISNETAVVKENGNTSTVEVIHSNTIPEVETSCMINSSNSVENQSKTSNKDSIQKEQDATEDIQDGARDSDLNKSSNHIGMEKDMAEEVIEDIMDVDFSDDF